jgi:hypothetical protein
MKGVQREEARVNLQNAKLRGRVLQQRLGGSSQRLSGNPEADFAAGLITPEDFDYATRAQRQTRPTGDTQVLGRALARGGLRPGEQARPIPGTAGQGIEVTGQRTTPPATGRPPTILEMQEGLRPRPGHPIYYGERAPTRSAEVRGGEPLTPSVAGKGPQAPTEAARTGAAGQAQIAARQAREMPFAQLRQLWHERTTTPAIRSVIEQEFQRRGIVFNPDTRPQ